MGLCIMCGERLLRTTVLYDYEFGKISLQIHFCNFVELERYSSGRPEPEMAAVFDRKFTERIYYREEREEKKAAKTWSR